MGLKITTSLHTNKGETSEMYLNIENIMVSKQNMNNVMFNKYINKEARDTDANNRCECFEVSSSYMLDFEQGDLSEKYLYDLVYGMVKTKLEAQGLVVEDLK